MKINTLLHTGLILTLALAGREHAWGQSGGSQTPNQNTRLEAKTVIGKANIKTFPLPVSKNIRISVKGLGRYGVACVVYDPKLVGSLRVTGIKAQFADRDSRVDWTKLNAYAPVDDAKIVFDGGTLFVLEDGLHNERVLAHIAIPAGVAYSLIVDGTSFQPNDGRGGTKTCLYKTGSCCPFPLGTPPSWPWPK